MRRLVILLCLCFPLCCPPEPDPVPAPDCPTNVDNPPCKE